jgi:phosphatidylserine/phosphatidylglycerophosphate/cardiolipin synthase-like enzyme
MTSRSSIFASTHTYCLSPDAPQPFRNLPRHVSSVGATWANGQPFSNHAKLVAVDDEAFYIGSQNLYPGRLQELGVIVENRDAAHELDFTYLTPMWGWSQADALTDPATNKCGIPVSPPPVASATG